MGGTLGGGADVFPQAAQLGYRGGDGFVGVERLWRVQPVGAAELVLVF
jgi:hypothetical protein